MFRIKRVNLPPTDPFHIPSLNIDRQLTFLNIKAKLRNVLAFGGRHYSIQQLNANPNDLTVTFKIYFPRLECSGEYDLQGKLLLLSLNNVGTFKGNFSTYFILYFANIKHFNIFVSLYLQYFHSFSSNFISTLRKNYISYYFQKSLHNDPGSRLH